MDAPGVEDEQGAANDAAAAAAAHDVNVGPIFASLAHRTLEELGQAIEERPELLRLADAESGWTLLHFAVHGGWSLDKIEHLIEASPESVRTRGLSGGQLPIHLLNSSSNDPSVAVRLAREYPAALRLTYEHTPNRHVIFREGGHPPFHCAVKNGAPMPVVFSLFLLRYEPTLAASRGWEWLCKTLLRAAKEKCGEDGERYLYRALESSVGATRRQFSPEDTAEDGNLALQLAVQGWAGAAVARLLRWAWPASVTTRDRTGMNPLHHAVQRGASREVVALLVQWRPQTVRERDNTGNLPVHYVFAAWRPSADNRAQLLIHEWPGSLQEENNAGELPLHWAAQTNSLASVQLLVERFPDAVRRRANDGALPLHKAARSVLPGTEPRVVPYLFEQWPDSVRVVTKDGRTALHYVAGRGEETLTDLLLSHDRSLTRARANDGALPLHDAVNFSLFDLLGDVQRLTSQAARHLGVVRLLVEQDPESVRERTTKDGFTPLHRAVRRPDEIMAVELAQILVQVDPDLGLARANGGWLPIHCAAGMAPLALIRYLDGTWPEALGGLTDEGYTPLHCASMLPRSSDVIGYLAERRPEAVSRACKHGMLPLHYAARHQTSLESVRVLVERQPATVRATDFLGNLPIHLALSLPPAVQVPIEIVRLLVDAHLGSLEVPNREGVLPLHLAVIRADTSQEIVKYLADQSPRTLQVRFKGFLPVALAALNDAPQDLLFFLVTKWPDCVRQMRTTT